MIYRLVRGVHAWRVQDSGMSQRSFTPAPESRRTRTTKPPSGGVADAEVEDFERIIKERDEETARLANLARVYGVNAVR